MRFQFYIALFIGFITFQNSSFAQCVFSNNSWGSGAAPNTTGTTVTISTCNYYGEYSPVTDFSSSNIYILDINDGGYITVFNSSGTAVAYGSAPLSFTPPSNGNYDIQWNGTGCSVDNVCHTTSVTNNGPSSACSDPAIAGSVIASVQTACSGSPFTLSLSGASLGTGLTYQWQSSTDGISYSGIVGATSSTYSATQTAATYYMCIVTCSAGTPVASSPLMVDMGNCAIMSNGSTTSCSGNFYDSGAGTANYGNSESFTYTITPSTPGAFLQIVFNSFNLESCCDEMTVYNGNSVAAPLMGSFGTNPGAITSSAADGSLTFVFTSDGSVVYNGWEASIGCITSAPTNDLVCSPEIIPVDGTVNYFTNGAATVEANETNIAPPSTGFNSTDGWGLSTLEHTVWFTFDAPASGNVTISCLDMVMDGQVAVYEVGSCSDFSTFNFIGGNDNDVNFTSDAPKFTLCGLTPGQTYYLLYDSGNGYASGPFSISISDLTLTAGNSTGVIDVCNGATVDLFDGISGNDAGGTWEETTPTFGLTGSVWNTEGVAFQVFDFLYVVNEGCLYDTAVAQVHVFGPSSAGNDGTINACKLETINLLSGLSGNVDLGGTWYNPSNQALTSSVITTSAIPGQFNYDYVASNGVCPEDTANVLVIVSDCVAGIEVVVEKTTVVFPNPSKGKFNLVMEDYNGAALHITDINGRSVSFNETTSAKGIQIELNKSTPGIYFLQITQNGSRYIQKLVVE